MMDTLEAGSVEETIRNLAARWSGADKRILKHVFPLLVEGQPVPVRRIAEAARCETAVADAALDQGRAERDPEGRVIELSGLTLRPTLHRLGIEGVGLFGCCALMVHQVPMLTGRPIEVESIDPVSRAIVKLSIDPDGIRGVDSREAVASFVVTDAIGVERDVCGSFCSHVRHFATSGSARTFVERDSRRFILSIEALHDAARMLYAKAWRDS